MLTDKTGTVSYTKCVTYTLNRKRKNNNLVTWAAASSLEHVPWIHGHESCYPFHWLFVFNFLKGVPFFLMEVFLLCWRVVHSAVVVSGGQQRGSRAYVAVPLPPQTPLPSRLPRHAEQSSLCSTVQPCWPSVLNTAVFVTVSHSLRVFHSAGYKPTAWKKKVSSAKAERKPGRAMLTEGECAALSWVGSGQFQPVCRFCLRCPC